ncbi:MAG: hypothetical protein ACLU4J_09455 [Butyricimonas paravirosa]
MSQEFTISSGPLPGSEKIYVKGEMFDIEVPMRRINLTPTVDTDGTKIENEPVVVYYTSGPYTDPNYTVDLHKGLPKIREQWIADRNDTVKLEGLSSEYGRARQNDHSLDALRFEHVNTTPRVAKPGHRVSQMYYARQGIITPEMEYIAIREPDGHKIRSLQERERRRWAQTSRNISPRIRASEVAPGGPSSLRISTTRRASR